MSNYVFVINTNKLQQNPVHPAQARKLLKEGKAAVFRRYPLTIILKEVGENKSLPIALKIDPGAKTTGLALVSNNRVIWGGQITHRGALIKEKLQSRANCRRGRRNRNIRYRQPRFLNRTRPLNWLAPSLNHRVLTTMTWVKRLCKYAPITTLVQELVRFDTQQLLNPEISGVEYQQGTLFGYEVREYLLEKWGRNCVYCAKKDTPLDIAKFSGVVGRLTTRSNGRFYLTTATKQVINIKPNSLGFIQAVQRKDGYEYAS